MDVLALGSVVYLRGSMKTVMVVGRKAVQQNGDEEYYFDYIGVLYPEGIVGADQLFFNAEDVSSVVSNGYVNDAENEYQKRILAWEKQTSAKKLSVEELREMEAKKKKVNFNF